MNEYKHVEETLLKFFYGECTLTEMKEVHQKLCDSQECQEYLENITELLRFLRSADDDTVEAVSWDDLRARFDQVLHLIDEPPVA